jgi:hypothetical protein
MMIDGGIDLFSSCLEPGGAVTGPHQGKTRNTQKKGEQNSTMSLDLKAVADFFSLENAERFLNCVNLPVDPRSPNTRAMGLTFTFSNIREEGGDGVDERRQDSSNPGKQHFSGREATELSFMAEREAVMNGDRMTDEDAEDNVFQYWQRGWDSSALASTPKVSNYFHFPSTLSPQAADDSIASPVNLDTQGDDIGVFFTGTTSLDVPGGLWSLESNDVSDGNKTSISASLSNSCNVDDRVNYEGIEVKAEEKEEKEGERDEDLVMMMRSPTNQNIPYSRSESRRDNMIVEGPKDDLFLNMKMRLKDTNNIDHSAYNSAQDDPILAAQIALTQANYNYWPEDSQRNEEQAYEEREEAFQEGVSNDSDSYDSQADTPAKYYPGLTEDEEVVVAKSSSSLKSEAVAFQLRDEENSEDDEYSSYYPGSNELTNLSPPTNIEHDLKVIGQPPYESKKYSDEDEANRHFDEIFSSFELSLNRNAVSDNESSIIHVRDKTELQNSPNHHNRTKLSSLAAAAHKMKTQGTCKDTLQVKQHDARRANYSSSIPSTFLEGTVMGRKLNHRFTPPSSPASSDTSKPVAISSIRNASESIINHANRSEKAHHRPTLQSLSAPSKTSKQPTSYVDVSPETYIDLASKTIFEAKNRSTTTPFSDDRSESSDLSKYLVGSLLSVPSDTTKVLARSDGNDVERLIDRVKKTIFQANDTLETAEYDMHTEMKITDVSCEIIDYNLDEIDFKKFRLQDMQLQDRLLEQSISEGCERGMKRGTEIDDDCPDDEKIIMRDFEQNGSMDVGDDVTLDKLLNDCHKDLFGDGEGGNSFDSTVNWDGLHYSMSDSLSVSNNSYALNLQSPTFKTTNSRSVSCTMTKIDKDADGSAALLNATRPPLSPPRQSNGNHVEDERLKEIANKNNASSDLPKKKQDRNENKSSTNERRPISSNGTMSCLHTEKHTTPLSPKNGNDAWDSIEQIKHCHDEEIRNIQMIANDIIKASSSPIVVASTSPKENVAPLSPRNSHGTTTSHLNQAIKSVKKNDEQGGHRELLTPMTPRSFEEVQKRIDAMREQHKMNMDKMRGALADIKEDSARYNGSHCGNEYANNSSSAVKNDDAHIAQCVGTRKLDTKRSNKAKERYSSWKTNINSSARHHGEHDTRSHFKFDDAIMEKESLSPRVKELMLENEELEGEMWKIRLLSPRNSTLSPSSMRTNDSSASPDHLHTPSSARYATPRPSSHQLCTPSSARCTTPNSSSGAQYYQSLHTILSDESEPTPPPPPPPPMTMTTAEHLLEELF